MTSGCSAVTSVTRLPMTYWPELSADIRRFNGQRSYETSEPTKPRVTGSSVSKTRMILLGQCAKWTVSFWRRLLACLVFLLCLLVREQIFILVGVEFFACFFYYWCALLYRTTILRSSLSVHNRLFSVIFISGSCKIRFMLFIFCMLSPWKPWQFHVDWTMYF